MSAPVKTLDVLRAARKGVANAATWCKGEFGLRADGTAVVLREYIDGNDVARCCALGRVYRTGLRLGLTLSDIDPLVDALDRIAARDFRAPDLAVVNDDIGRLAALQLLDTAISELESQ